MDRRPGLRTPPVECVGSFTCQRGGQVSVVRRRPAPRVYRHFGCGQASVSRNLRFRTQIRGCTHPSRWHGQPAGLGCSTSAPIPSGTVQRRACPERAVDGPCRRWTRQTGVDRPRPRGTQHEATEGTVGGVERGRGRARAGDGVQRRATTGDGQGRKKIQPRAGGSVTRAEGDGSALIGPACGPWTACHEVQSDTQSDADGGSEAAKADLASRGRQGVT
jgi:hypothetical protein